LSLNDALKAFAALKETPEFFRWYIERYLIYQHQGPEQALQYIRARIHDDTGYTKTWKELNRADRAILLLAARGVQDLYGIHAHEQLKDLLGSPNVTVTLPERRHAGLRVPSSNCWRAWITALIVSRIRNSKPGSLLGVP
jgi:hypothetical protein